VTSEKQILRSPGTVYATLKDDQKIMEREEKIMKKLTTLITAACVIFSTAAMAQDHQPIKARDGTGTDTFGVPVRLREDVDIQNCVGDYQTARNAFQAEMQQLRLKLASASATDQAAIREQIREQLKAHRETQVEFRKNLRGIMGQMRQQRVGARVATGG
jgi:Skp family chaperone for outer membrane proteins